MMAKLIEASDLCPEVRNFTFEAEGQERFPFLPGQFVSFHETLGGKRITRAYSIASPPDGNRFELCLNRVQAGLFSPHLFAMQPGEMVEMTGPLGYFTLRNPDRDCVFIATGTGIAPFRSMLHAHLAEKPGRRFTLIFGVRYETHIMYRGEFEHLAAQHKNFVFQPTVTRPEPSWTGRTGRVQQHLFEAIGDRKDIDVYVCGLKEMVDEVRALLKGRGFDRKQIIFEKYD